MSQSARQMNLYSAEDWTAPYRAFAQANFAAYDYESIRSAMVDYIRRNFPENYSDWIQSAEFVMLIELIAFLGHNLAFRIDMAGRENFLATAERRESVLRIADMLGYQPARHRPASGLLKIRSIRIDDPNAHSVAGDSLRGKEVDYDRNHENFTLVLNRILAATNRVGPGGRPEDSAVVDGVRSDIYRIESIPAGSPPVFKFNARVNGTPQQFEVHGLTIDHAAGRLRETEPDPASSLSIVRRNDGQGSGSPGTGFFLGFKQGSLEFRDVSIENPIPNMVVDHAAGSVNESDVWVQALDSRGEVARTWTKADPSFGASPLFNSEGNFVRSLYSVKTLDGDRINFVFGDGVFSDIPKGVFRFWTRSGTSQSYALDPSDVGDVSVKFDYRGSDGNTHQATIRAELTETVANATASESVESIQRNAGRAFASQNRMVTGADYSIMPFTVSDNVRKIKASNRTFTGHGRYLLERDPTGEYQNVEMVASDGYIYKDPVLHQRSAVIRAGGAGASSLGPEQIFEQFIDGIAADPDVINLYYAEYASKGGAVEKTEVNPALYVWQHISRGYQSGTGYITEEAEKKRVGELADSSALRKIRVGSIIEFVGDPYVDGSIGAKGSVMEKISGGSGYSGDLEVAIAGTGEGAEAKATLDGNGAVTKVEVVNGGAGYHGNTVATVSGGGGKGAVFMAFPQVAESMWARVVDIHEDGLGSEDASGNRTGLTERGHGAISLNRAVPNKARIRRVFPAFNTRFSAEERAEIVKSLQSGSEFGLKYDETVAKWAVIGVNDLPDYTKENNAASAFTFDNPGGRDNSWIVRAIKHGNDRWEILVRKARLVFGSDESLRFFDRDSGQGIAAGRVGMDKIVVSAVNSRPDHWRAIGREIVFSARGQFTGSDGHADSRKMVVALADSDSDRYPDNPMAFHDLVGLDDPTDILLHTIEEGGHRYEVRAGAASPKTRFVDGRHSLVFTWKRVASGDVRVDPAIGNIVDVNVMTRTYDEAFRRWMADDRNPASMPSPPSAAALEKQFEDLDSKRSVSDSVIYRPGRYRILFGELAEPAMRGTFQVVKVAGTSLSDNEIKSRVLDAIVKFFDIDNWEFGESFYFTQLSSYIHREMQGVVGSIVIKPTSPGVEFGGLFQINPGADELLIPDVSLDGVEIVDALTDDVLGSGR